MEVSYAFNFLIYIYILLVAVNYGDSLNTEEDMPLPLCSRKCHNTADTTDEPLSKCSCSPSCVTYGDCCYDSDYRHETTGKSTDFICISLVNGGRFKAVSGCPADQNSVSCKNGIGYMPPVTSRVTNTTYANLFCANCNGDGENLAVWNADLRCNDRGRKAEILASHPMKIVYDYSDFRWLNEITRFKEFCKYHVQFDNFTLLDSLELRNCDTLKIVSDCVPNWKNSTIMNLCRSYEDLVYIERTVAFRNMHCVMCNYIPTKYAQCDYIPKVIPSTSDIPSCPTCRRPFNFHRIISIDPLPCIPDPGKRCCPHEEYDRRSKRCRIVYRD